MSATVLPPPSVAGRAPDTDTDVVTAFLRQQFARIDQVTAGARTPELQSAVHGALIDDLTHMFAAALGTLVSMHGDPEATLGPAITTMMTAMQAAMHAQRDGRRA